MQPIRQVTKQIPLSLQFNQLTLWARTRRARLRYRRRPAACETQRLRGQFVPRRRGWGTVLCGLSRGGRGRRGFRHPEILPRPFHDH